LLMAFNFILNLAGRISLSLIMLGIQRNHISNLRKPVFNATCAVSVFYANW
ncbi:hypothetical protein T12_14044, partial [Trichinella patagoniensis]